MQEEQTDTQGAAAREREGGDYGTREGDEGHTKERRWCWQTVNSVEAQGEGKHPETHPEEREGEKQEEKGICVVGTVHPAQQARERRTTR